MGISQPPISWDILRAHVFANVLDTFPQQQADSMMKEFDVFIAEYRADHHMNTPYDLLRDFDSGKEVHESFTIQIRFAMLSWQTSGSLKTTHMIEENKM